MFPSILYIAAAIVVVVLGLAARKPNTLVIQRSAIVNASADDIYPFIEDFHDWSRWSPYEKLDPRMEKSYSGASRGKGSVYEWSGRGKAGAGRMEITGTTYPSKVHIDMDFTRPFKSHSTADFTLVPNGYTTAVTWVMRGPNSFFGKVMSVFGLMDRMIGKDFAVGLSNLKSLAESSGRVERV